MSRRISAFLIAVVAVALLVVPAVQAQEDAPEGDYVTVQEPSFSWTGKEDQTANFSWSATVHNPYKRPVWVNVTLLLLDGSGNVISTDTEQVEISKEGMASVSRDGSLAYGQASQAQQYRIAVEGSES